MSDNLFDNLSKKDRYLIQDATAMSSHTYRVIELTLSNGRELSISTNNSKLPHWNIPIIGE